MLHGKYSKMPPPYEDGTAEHTISRLSLPTKMNIPIPEKFMRKDE